MHNPGNNSLDGFGSDSGDTFADDRLPLVNDSRSGRTGWKPVRASLLLLLLLIGLGAGCRTQTPSAPESSSNGPVVESPLRILVVDDPPLAEAIEREWRARSERQVELRQSEAAGLASSGAVGADLIIYPSGMLGQLAEAGQIVPFPVDALSGAQIARSDIFSAQLQIEARWGNQVMALPLGSPQFCLLYRRDLLESHGLSLPSTWTEYQEFARRLGELPAAGTESSEGDGEGRVQAEGQGGGKSDWHGLAEPLAEGWAGQVLLARAASYARHRSQYSTLFNFNTMEPLIAGPPFVKALEEMVAAYRSAPTESLDWTPDDVREAYFAGRLGLALTWPTRGRAGGAPVAGSELVPPGALVPPDALGVGGESGAEIPTGFAELPGSADVYGVVRQQWESRRGDEPSRIPLLGVAGRLGSVTRESRRTASAADALAWISGRDWSPAISPVSSATTLFRQSHVDRPELWVEPQAAATAGEYAELVQQLQSGSDILLSLRIPGRARYLAELDGAVRRAVQGQVAPAEALSEVAASWGRLTDELGRDKQRDAYARSLGLQP